MGFFLDVERGEPPEQAQPLVQQGIHWDIFFIFKNALTVAEILLEIATFNDSLNSEWFIIN